MNHIDAALHTQGASIYCDDLPPPEGMLQVAVFGSPVAHGRVKDLDIEAAAEADGVVAVFTAKDVIGKNVIGPIIQDEVLFCDEFVSYVGHPLAMVIAETDAQADDPRRKQIHHKTVLRPE